MFGSLCFGCLHSGFSNHCKLQRAIKIPFCKQSFIPDTAWGYLLSAAHVHTNKQVHKNTLTGSPKQHIVGCWLKEQRKVSNDSQTETMKSKWGNKSTDWCQSALVTSPWLSVWGHQNCSHQSSCLELLLPVFSILFLVQRKKQCWFSLKEKLWNFWKRRWNTPNCLGCLTKSWQRAPKNYWCLTLRTPKFYWVYLPLKWTALGLGLMFFCISPR